MLTPRSARPQVGRTEEHARVLDSRRTPCWSLATRQLRRRSQRFQGSAPARAGIRAARARLEADTALVVGNEAVAAAKPTPSGICPAAGGDPSGGIPLGGIPLADKRSAPSRSRLRPAHPIDLRRSDCRAGVPSSFGAPCSVHSETYRRIPRPSSAPNATRSQIATFTDRGLFSRWIRLESANSRKNAPRSVLPRPTYRPTSAEAFACRRAINLGRSFLGAPGTLDRQEVVVKQCRKQEDRCLRSFLYNAHILA